ncbi:MAG: hypothetical protein JNL58_18740 [Planctomyces sp.]|nr:hypothetical protein [Planctomyces sp.]
MSKVKPFLFGSLLGAATMFGAMQFHVVRSHDGFQFVPRTPQHSLGLAYADIRNWNATQWTDRPELARALMAHGSSDLIAQSVADSLADSVSAESATLDQLRTFLNKASDGTEVKDVETFKIPGIEPLRSEDSAPSGFEGLKVPAAEARRPNAADAFRVAGSDAATVPAPREKSRFSADDILGAEESPFNEVPSETSSKNPGAPAGASGAVPSSVKESKSFTDAVFGPSASTGGASASGATSAGTAAGTNPSRSTQPTTGSGSSSTAKAAAPFEDVTADLESRARSALSRAQSSLQGKASETTSAVREGSGQYVREQLKTATDAAAESVSAAVKSNTSAETLEALQGKFDPFLE